MMRVYRLGDVFAIQTEGFPIGGPLSYAYLFLVLAFLEAKFRDGVFAWIRQHGNHNPRVDNFSFDEILTAKRYVDDTSCTSGVLCQTCVSSVPKACFKTHIDFEPNTERKTEGTSIFAKFLDLWVCVGGQWYAIGKRHPERPHLDSQVFARKP